MRDLIKRYIDNCHNCRRIKSVYDERIDLLKFLFIFKQRWIDIFMNFVINFSNLKNHNVICIIIDRLIKKRHYVSCIVIDENIVVNVCVRIFLHYVFRTHELFFTIVSNKNSQFVNVVWNRFCKKLSIKCKLSNAHHFQTNDCDDRV